MMPWVDMLAGMKEQDIPLFTLENRKPLNQFHAVGFTLQYEMSYTNILHMLALGGIPVHNEERAEADPIVLAGGPCAYHPEPLHLLCGRLPDGGRGGIRGGGVAGDWRGPEGRPSPALRY